MRAQGFLLFLSAHIYIFIPLVVKLFILFSYQFWIFTALQQCRERSISSLLAVLKFYHPTFDLFLPVIQEEIPFNESSIFTFALCNL